MSRQFTIRDFHQLTQAERDVMLDRLFKDVQAHEPEQEPPPVILGQGDFRMEYTPEPIAWRVGRPVAVGVCVLLSLAVFVGAVLLLERWLA